jgi:hypothetical protein
MHSYIRNLKIRNLKNIFHTRFEEFHHRINLIAPFLVPEPESFKTYLNQFDLLRPRTGNSLVYNIYSLLNAPSIAYLMCSESEQKYCAIMHRQINVG